MRRMTSASQACGTVPLSSAGTIIVYIAAARSPPRSEPANSHDQRLSAMPRNAHSAAWLLRQIRPLAEEAGEGQLALEHVIHRLRHLAWREEPVCSFESIVSTSGAIRVLHTVCASCWVKLAKQHLNTHSASEHAEAKPRHAQIVGSV